MQIEILLGCEHSQTLTEQFALRGINVTSCDLYPGDKGYNHVQGDVEELLKSRKFHAAVFFPPCTFLAKAQFHLLGNPERLQKSDDAVDFAKRLYFSDIPFVAIENPIGRLSKVWRQPDQIISPHMFGDAYMKDVGLWLRGFQPIMTSGQGSWDGPGTSSGQAADVPGIYKSVSNHVNSRMSREEKSKVKSSWKWFPNMAAAIAEQWSNELKKYYK